MKIVEMNQGKKIDYSLAGTTLDFADGALALNLARYQQDEPVVRDIMVDADGYLTTGRGRYYAAQVEIPAQAYAEEPAAENDDASAEQGSAARTPLPLNTDDVTLYLFAIDGITIH